MPNTAKDLNNTIIVLMVSTALFYDVLQWFLVFFFLDWVVSIFAAFTFYLWFKIYGISFLSPKRASIFGGAIAIESVPFISAFLSWLPAWTAAVLLLALDSKIKKVVPGLDIIKK